MKKEITALRNSLDKISTIETEFKPIRPYIKKYFKKNKKF